MSATDSAEATNTIEPCQSGDSSLSSGEHTLSYMKLEQTRITSFQWAGETHKVVDAPAEAFDSFITQVVEEIINVDRAAWDIYDRWNIINACLEAEVLALTELPDGSLQLADVPEVEE